MRFFIRSTARTSPRFPYARCHRLDPSCQIVLVDHEWRRELDDLLFVTPASHQYPAVPGQPGCPLRPVGVGPPGVIDELDADPQPHAADLAHPGIVVQQFARPLERALPERGAALEEFPLSEDADRGGRGG